MLLWFTQLLSVVFAGLNFSSPFAITSCISKYIIPMLHAQQLYLLSMVNIHYGHCLNSASVKMLLNEHIRSYIISIMCLYY